MFLVLTFGLSGGVVQAHGGGIPQLTNAETGPYLVSVWTQPDPLRVGEVHFTVAVSEPGRSQQEAGSPVLDATIELTLIAADENERPLNVSATHTEAVNKLFYEADIDVPGQGIWQVITTVAGPAGTGETEFSIEVLPFSTFNWWIVLGGGTLVLIAVGLIMAKFSGQKGE